MKKILMIALCLVLVPMLFAGKSKAPIAPDHNFTAPNIGSSQYTGSRSTPTLVDVIDLGSISLYCFGLTYDWERDGLWVIPFSYENWVYCIQKTSPCTKIDSFQLVGAPAFHLGIGYAGGDVMYAMGYDGYVYEVDMTTGVVSSYRSIPPWPNYGISCGFNTVDDVIYGADWGFDGCSYAQPSQTGTWNTWALSSACGASGAYGASSPAYLFYCNEDATQAQFFQHSVTAGVPNTTPDSVWDCDPSQSQESTADCTFDGQYVYIIDQGDPDKIFIYDVGIEPPGDILYVDDDNDATLSGYFETSFSNLGMVYDIWVVTDSSDVTPDASVMGTYDIVVWTTGDDYSSTFVGNDTIEVANYLAGGGKMWLSSEDILYNLGPVSWLHVGSYSDDVGCTAATGVGPIMTGTSFATTGGIVWDYSDEIYPDAFAWTEMQNETPVDNTIAMDPTTGLPYYLFFNAFPFENIDAEADRDTMMSRILSWLTGVHDVGCASVVSPPEGSMVPAADYDVIGQICNHGDYVETFDVTAHVYDTLDSWNLIFDATVTLTDFPIGADSNVNFGTVTFNSDKVYYTEIYTELVDANPGNDTSAIYTNTFAPYVIWDFETGWQGWTHTSGQTFPAAWSVWTTTYPGGPYWTYQPPPDAGDSAFIIDSDAAGSGIWVVDTAMSPVVEGPDSGLTFLKWGMFLQYDDMQVLFREWTPSGWGAWNVVYAYSGTTGPQWDSVDISAYTGDSIQVAFQYDDGNSWLYGATFDNVMLFANPTGIAEGFPVKDISAFGFAPDMSTLTKGHPAISYSTTAMGKVSLKIYDNTGRLIRTLVDRPNEAAGTKSVYWNRKDDTGRTVANGIYFIRLEAENQYDTHKLILVK